MAFTPGVCWLYESQPTLGVLDFHVSIATSRETEEDARGKREKKKRGKFSLWAAIIFFKASHDASVISVVNVKGGQKKRGMKHTSLFYALIYAVWFILWLTPDRPEKKKHTLQWFKGV